MEEIEDDKYIQVDDKTIILQSNSSEMPTRLTPTGKISYAKTRVYTQRYRKEWELMNDFKGWLTCVPHEPTRAFCKYCKKDLHAHRLSLLKHMCTMKHQRSALMYHNVMVAKRKEANKNQSGIDEDLSENDEIREELEEVEEGVDFSIEEMETEEEISFPEHKYARDISEEEDQKSRVKIIKLESQDNKRDKLAEAMAHVHGESSEVNAEHVQLDMDVVSETVETSDFAEVIAEPLSENQNLTLASIESTEADLQNSEGQSSDIEQTVRKLEFEDIPKRKTPQLKKMTSPISNTITITPNNKTLVMTSSGKTVKLTSGKVNPASQYLFSTLKGKTNFVTEKKKPFISIAPKPSENKSPQQEEASTSQAKKVLKLGKPSPQIFIKKPTISTHALDMGKGLPIGGLQVSLYKLLDGRWTFVNECNTSTAGRCADLIDSEKNALTTGRYKLHFDVDKYFSLRKIETLYPFIEIVFDVKNPGISYNIPILLSPFGYTTYRGMDR